MCETRKVHKAKEIGHWPGPASQRALQMLNGDEQNQVKVLPDLPTDSPAWSLHKKQSGEIDSASLFPWNRH